MDDELRKWFAIEHDELTTVTIPVHRDLGYDTAVEQRAAKVLLALANGAVLCKPEPSQYLYGYPAAQEGQLVWSSSITLLNGSAPLVTKPLHEPLEVK